MDIQKTIDELKRALDHTISEEEVLEIISGRLAVLRESFRSGAGSFTYHQIEFLKELTPISNHIKSFVDLKGELSDVHTMEDYSRLVSQLSEIKKKLEPFAVAKRVAKEIRELHERLPDIKLQDQTRREFRVQARILELEQDAPRCQHKHPMVVREGPTAIFGAAANILIARKPLG
jgi:hypothetical protein